MAGRCHCTQLAKQCALLDHFFHAAFGGGFLNRFWLICACTRHAMTLLLATWWSSSTNRVT